MLGQGSDGGQIVCEERETMLRTKVMVLVYSTSKMLARAFH